MTDISQLSRVTSVSDGDAFLIYSGNNVSARLAPASEVQSYVLAGLTSILDNLTATAAPTASSDISLGYSIGSRWAYNGLLWNCTANTLGAAVWKLVDPFFASGAPGTALTGTVAETVLASITLPANLVNVGKGLRVRIIASATNNGNNKTLRVRIGGVAGTLIGSNVANSVAAYFMDRQLILRNATTLVGAATADAVDGAAVTSSNAPVTYAVDLTANTTLDLTGQLADAGDTMTLESYSIELVG